MSLDYGDPELLGKFQKIYRVNEMPPEKAHQGRALEPPAVKSSSVCWQRVGSASETQRPSALMSGALSERLILVTILSQARSSRFGYSRYTQCILPFCAITKLHLL